MWLKSNDIDYSVVMEDKSVEPIVAYNAFVKDLKEKWVQIFLETPDYLTVRGLYNWDAVDFVIARKETYDSESRKPIVELAWLYDDLKRRDFSINAIAKSVDWQYIDFFYWQIHIRDKVLHAPRDAERMINEDPLRAIRAIRFMFVLWFTLSTDLAKAIETMDMENFAKKVSIERVYDEFMKWYKKDKHIPLKMLNLIKKAHKELYTHILKHINFIPSLKQ